MMAEKNASYHEGWQGIEFQKPSEVSLVSPVARAALETRRAISGVDGILAKEAVERPDLRAFLSPLSPTVVDTTSLGTEALVAGELDGILPLTRPQKTGPSSELLARRPDLHPEGPAWGAA